MCCARTNEQTKMGEPMTLAEMELALARIDVMIGFLKGRATERTNPKITEEIVRYQQWRDDLDLQIGLERIRRNTDHRRKHRPLGS
jgi:hypothetical protein